VGVIHDVQPHELSILVKQPLAEGSAVSIEFGAVTCDAEVVSCCANGGRYEAGIVMANRKEFDLRAAERFPVTQAVRISAGSLDSEMDAEVVDLSTHGVGLELPAPLEPQESVTLETALDLAFGTVRYCRRLPDGRFHAGVQVFHIMPKEIETCERRSEPSRLRRLLHP
jgi:hypothetical protein